MRSDHLTKHVRRHNREAKPMAWQIATRKLMTNPQQHSILPAVGGPNRILLATPAASFAIPQMNF